MKLFEIILISNGNFKRMQYFKNDFCIFALPY